MAAAGRMLSVIREELPTVVNELASTAKLSTEQVGRLGEMEIASTATTAGAGLNPLAVRQMASASIKEGGKSFCHICGKELIVESSILSSLRQGPNRTTSLLEHLPTPSQLPSINTSMVSQTLEMDVGVSVREAISNATQTGAGEVLEQVQLGDLAKVVAGGPAAHV